MSNLVMNVYQSPRWRWWPSRSSRCWCPEGKTFESRGDWLLFFIRRTLWLQQRQDQKRAELDEQLKEYISEWRKQRVKEEEDLKRLKEKQAKRKVSRETISSFDSFRPEKIK